MEEKMEKNQIMTHGGENKAEIVPDGNKKSWMPPLLARIDTSRSTEFEGVAGDDGEAGFS